MMPLSGMRKGRDATLKAVEKAAALWRRSAFAIALTGAGLSVGSGIPDFRSPGGLWSRFDPMDVATAEALRRRPEKVWEFLLEAARLMGSATPNPAHAALARLEAGGQLQAVITQNIDNLHQAAGSHNVIEFHGGVGRYYCMGCGRDFDPDMALSLRREDLPWLCNGCGGLVRPGIVFFGEAIPLDALEKSGQLALSADLVLVAGTSGEVAPANALPGRVKARGGTLIEINLEASAYSDMADARIHAPVEEVLPLLAEMLLG